MIDHPHALFFDLDGTLVDTAPDFITVVHELQRARGLSESSPALLQVQVSNGAGAVVRAGFPDLSTAEQDELIAAFLVRYGALAGAKARLYDGMASVLNYLAETHTPWGIVTNKPARFTYPLLEHLQLPGSAPVVVCGDEVPQAKPAPDALIRASELAQSGDHCTWYVGDHRRDIEAARAAGQRPLAAAWGYLSSPQEAQSWGAEAVLQHPLDLISWLQSVRS